MLELIFPAFGTHLRNTDPRCIVNDQVGTPNDICSLYQLRPVLILEVTCTHILGIHMGFHRQQTVHELFLGHFQTEDRNGDILAERHILCDIQNERRLSHGRTGRYQHQV